MADAATGHPTTAPARRQRTPAEKLRSLLLRAETASIAGALFVFVGFSLASPLFLTKESFISITNVVAELGILAVGVTILMISGHIDLSVGAVLGISSYIVVYLGQSLGVPTGVAFIGALLFAMSLGLVNGLLVIKTGLHSFIVTLGTMLIYRGLLTAWSGGFPVSTEISEPLRSIVVGPLLDGFRMSLVWFLLAVIGATWLLLRTRTGNWIYAIGQNPEAARNLGVPVARTSILLFMLASLAAGAAGVIQVARFQSVDALRGEGTELLAIAITVIGGTLLTGGYGSAIGAMFGAFIFGMVQIGLVLVGAPGFYFKTLVGFTLVGAVLINTSFTKFLTVGSLGRRSYTPGKDEADQSEAQP
jgi:simple sugar transport system permease protein